MLRHTSRVAVGTGSGKVRRGHKNSATAMLTSVASPSIHCMHASKVVLRPRLISGDCRA